MLRGSILYASETYYNLTEKQLRSIEKIEEEYLRKILKTTKGYQSNISGDRAVACEVSDKEIKNIISEVYFG